MINCISQRYLLNFIIFYSYNSASSSVPVAQFIAPRPFSEKLKKLSISKYAYLKEIM
jgi:hypothetical protein